MKFLVFIFLFSGYAFAQSSKYECNLSIGTSPVIRGVALGLTRAEVEQIFPKNTGLNLGSTLIVDPHGRNIKGFDGINGFIIEFHQKNITGPEETIREFTVQYDPKKADWDSTDEFAEHVAPHLGISLDFFHHSSAFQRVATCNGFKVTLRKNNINIASTEIEDRLRLKTEREKADQKKAFKP